MKACNQVADLCDRGEEGEEGVYICTRHRFSRPQSQTVPAGYQSRHLPVTEIILQDLLEKKWPSVVENNARQRQKSV